MFEKNQLVRIKEEADSTPSPGRRLRGQTGKIVRGAGTFGEGRTLPVTADIPQYLVAVDDEGESLINEDWLEPL